MVKKLLVKFIQTINVDCDHVLKLPGSLLGTEEDCFCPNPCRLVVAEFMPRRRS